VDLDGKRRYRLRKQQLYDHTAKVVVNSVAAAGSSSSGKQQQKRKKRWCYQLDTLTKRSYTMFEQLTATRTLMAGCQTGSN
jgi:hypothetical protein